MRGLMAEAVCQSAEQADLALEFHASGFQGTWLDGCEMKKFLLGMLTVFALLAGVGREARATTVTGTLITNTVTATMTSVLGTPYEARWAQPPGSATANVLVVAGPVITLLKLASPTEQISGGTVTYRLWVENISPTWSAFNITVTDFLPDNVSYSGNPDSWNGGSFGTWFSYVSADGVSYFGGSPTIGQTAPYYLRWILTQLGPNRSAFVEFTVNIL